MSGAVVLAWDINGAPYNPTLLPAQALEDIDEFRALRPYFFGDYYPLTEYSTSDEAWATFQWNRPEETSFFTASTRPRITRSTTRITV